MIFNLPLRKATAMGCSKLGRSWFLVVALILAWAPWCLAADPAIDAASQWGRWRGPEANGFAPKAQPPLKWDSKKNVRWKVSVPGRGSSTPIVWGDKIFLLSASPIGAAPSGQSRRRSFRSPAPTRVFKFLVLCYDRKTGKKLWEQTVIEVKPHEGVHGTSTHASGSPVTDGKQLYVSFGSRGVYCYDLDGKLKWKRQLGQMRTRNSFGEGGSPALHGDTLVVPWDHEGQSFIVALDTKTGKTKWKVNRDEPTTWSTPLIVNQGKKSQVITNGTKRVRSYDLATGKLLWACGGQATNPIPTPILYGDMVVCMTGYRGYAIYAIPIGSKGDITGSGKEVWKKTDAAPYVSSPVLVGNQLYYTKSRSGTLLSVDALLGSTIIDQTRLPDIGSIYASGVAAGDRIYITGRDGTTVVLKHGSKLEVLAINKLDEPVDASMALVGKQIFVRGEKNLYCIEAK
jgi:outer membrane protein assembly factor BamB